LFPDGISFGSGGGPTRRTEIAVQGSGHEERNALWKHSRNEYNAGYGIQDLDHIYKIKAFFEARNAQEHSFRFWDPLDYKSCLPSKAITPIDQRLGVGDGGTQSFQLVIRYHDKISPYVKPILTPRIGSVRVAVDGVEKVRNVDFTIKSLTGIVTFVVPPRRGQRVTAGFMWDVPVRFNTDKLVINLATWQAGDAPSIPLIEVFLEEM
jgi:uncharacterized protein (TIGR02217 family)